MGMPSFGSPAIERFARVNRRRLPPRLASKIADVLERLGSVSSPADLRLAGYRVRRLKGDRKGSRSVRVSSAWRVVFLFQDGNTYDVELVDYHRG